MTSAISAVLPSAGDFRSLAAQRNMAMAVQGGKGNEAAVRKAAEEFESVFLSQMLSHMLKPMQLPKPFSGGHAEEMFHSLLVDAYAKEITRAGGIGVAEQISRELLSLQEINS